MREKILICDYCLQSPDTAYIIQYQSKDSIRYICTDCFIKVLDRILGTPEHKTDEMEKMFKIE